MLTTPKWSVVGLVGGGVCILLVVKCYGEPWVRGKGRLDSHLAFSNPQQCSLVRAIVIQSRAFSVHLYMLLGLKLSIKIKYFIIFMVLVVFVITIRLVCYTNNNYLVAQSHNVINNFIVIWVCYNQSKNGVMEECLWMCLNTSIDCISSLSYLHI